MADPRCSSICNVQDDSIIEPQVANAVRLGDGVDDNIILNPNFEDGLNNWAAWGGCKILLNESMDDGKIVPMDGRKYFASATERTQSWNGIQQDVTGRVQRKLAYEITASVRVFDNAAATATNSTASAEVRATVYIQGANGRCKRINQAINPNHGNHPAHSNQEDDAIT